MKRLRPLAPAVKISIGLHAAAPLAWAASPPLLPWLAGGVVANHACLAAAGMWPRSRLLGPNIGGLPANGAGRREIALTFDDGPDPAVTPRVLDMLERHGAHASFFCIGRRARAHPALVREIASRGHSVENHSNTHPYGFACYPPGPLRREILDAQAALADAAGTAPAFFRAPMGLRSPLLDPVLAETTLRFTSWTRRALDGVRGDPQAAKQRLLGGLAAGDVLLMHDGNCAKAPTGEPVVLLVLPAVLEAISAAGLRPVTLPEAFAVAESAGAAAGPSASAVHA